MASKRNYKVYAFVGDSKNSPIRKLVVLDTGAGPNFVRKSEFSPELKQKVTAGNRLPDIREARDDRCA